jgi:hypothetical protein
MSTRTGKSAAGSALGAGAATRSSGRLPARRVTVIGVIIAAVLAAALGVVLATHDGTGGRPGATGSSSSNQPSSRRPSTSSAPASSAASPTADPATGTTVCTLPLNTCTGSNATALQTEPAVITVSQDGAAYIKGLTWSGWGTATATGTGSLEADNCNPNCAEGHDTAYKATVTLSQLVPYGNGEQAYSTITVSVPGAPSRSETFSTGLVP